MGHDELSWQSLCIEIMNHGLYVIAVLLHGFDPEISLRLVLAFPYILPLGAPSRLCRETESVFLSVPFHRLYARNMHQIHKIIELSPLLLILCILDVSPLIAP